MIIGGAPKSGTTAIYYYLKQHPELLLSPKKELHFFSRIALEKTAGGPGDRHVLREVPSSFNEYLNYFPSEVRGRIAVDVSPSYLYHFMSANEITRLLPDAKIVFILRNPADKAFSQYLHLVGSGRENLSFSDALCCEKDRQQQGYADMWLYRESGFYANALSHYYHVFGQGRVRVYYYDDFRTNPEKVLRDIFSFAGIAEDVPLAPVTDVNRSGRPRSSLVSRVFLSPNWFTFLLRRIVPQGIGRLARKQIKDYNTGAKPGFPPNLRNSLLEDFRDDILRVEEILGRPSGWLK